MTSSLRNFHVVVSTYFIWLFLTALLPLVADIDIAEDHIATWLETLGVRGPEAGTGMDGQLYYDPPVYEALLLLQIPFGVLFAISIQSRRFWLWLLAEVIILMARSLYRSADGSGNTTLAAIASNLGDWLIFLSPFMCVAFAVRIACDRHFSKLIPNTNKFK